MSWRRCLLIFLVLSVAAAIFRTFVCPVDSQAAVFTVLLSLSELFFLATFIAYWSFQSDSRLALLGILLCYCDCFAGLVIPRSYLSLGLPYMHSGVHVVGLGLFAWGLVREHGRWRTLLEKTTRAEEKYRAIFENSAVGITVADAHERIVSWNHLAEELLGADRASLYMKPVLRQLKVRQRGRQLHFQTKMLQANGELIDVDISMSVVKDAAGNVQQSIGIIRNITARKQAEQRLAESEEKYRVLTESSVQPVSVVQSAELKYVNEAFAESLGYDDSTELVGRDFLDLVAAEDRPSQTWLFGSAAPHGVTRHTLRLLSKAGEMRWYEMQVTRIQYEGRPALLVTGRDISETKMLWEELNQQLLRDPLTGVYNRRYFNEIIMQEVKRADRYGYQTSFIMADIDGMKFVNDTYGHLVGDQLLCGVAEVLEESIRSADVVIRYGGDEFLVVMPQTTAEEAQFAVERIRGNFAEWLNDQAGVGALHRDMPAQVGFSMGVASHTPNSELAVEEILAQADEAMYRDKQAKRDLQSASE